MKYSKIFSGSWLMKWVSTVAVFFVIFSIGCVNNPKNEQNKLSGDLIIFHAGSLSVPFKEVADSFEKRYPNVNVKREAAGSVDCARKITDLKRKCDIMASADYKVISKFLIPDYTDWLIRFASNEMTLVYNEASKYSEEITRNNWYNILKRDDVLYGRSEPSSDPCGYRTVLSLRLAEEYYECPGMADQILSGYERYMRPKETDLLALLESHTVDYIFLYRSVAEQHGLKFLTLPDSLNLGNPVLDEWYHTASVKIAGKKPGEKMTIHGEPMIYGITMPENAPNPQNARAFLHFLLSQDQGMKIIEKNGQAPIIPASTDYYDNLPEGLEKYAKR